MQACQSKTPTPICRAGTVGLRATFEVKLRRATDELWGFAWSYNGISARRLIISGVNARSPAGGCASFQCGDELLSVNGAKGFEEMRRELYESLDVTLFFRSAAESPPPPSARRRVAPSDGTRNHAASTSRRQAPIAPPSIKARVKNSFIHFSDSEEVGESSDDGIFSTSDPLPISRLGKPLNFRSPYMSGCLAGVDLPRVAALCDSARSDEDWASARSLSSEEGNTSGDHSTQSILSCPSTEWDYPSYQPVAAFMPTPQYYHPVATALPNAHLNPMPLGRLMILPCPMNGVGFGSNTISSSNVADEPAPEPTTSLPPCEEPPDENSEVIATQGLQGEVSDNTEGSRPLTHVDPSDKSEGGSSEPGPPPITMDKFFDEGWLKPDDPQSSMDESTTYASTILGPLKKVRRGGKRMHRPCHQRAKQESQSQKESSPGDVACDTNGNQNSNMQEVRSFYPSSRKQKPPSVQVAGQTDTLSTAAMMDAETHPPEGERVSTAAAPATETSLHENTAISSSVGDGIHLDASVLDIDEASKHVVPEVQVSLVPKQKVSPMKCLSAVDLLGAPPEADLHSSKCVTPDVQLTTVQSSKAWSIISPGKLLVKDHVDAAPVEADLVAPETTVLEVQPSTEPKRIASAESLAASQQLHTPAPEANVEVSAKRIPGVQSARGEKRKISGRKSSRGAVAKFPDVPSWEADVDASKEKVPGVQPCVSDPTDTPTETDGHEAQCVAPDVQLSTVHGPKASPIRFPGEFAGRGELDGQLCESDPGMPNATIPEVHLSTEATSLASAGVEVAPQHLDTPPPEADLKGSGNSIPKVQSSRVEKRKVSQKRVSRGAAAKCSDVPSLEADVDASKEKVPDVQPCVSVPVETPTEADGHESKCAAPDVQLPTAQGLKASPIRSSGELAGKDELDGTPLEADLGAPKATTPEVHPSTELKGKTSAATSAAVLAAAEQVHMPTLAADIKVSTSTGPTVRPSRGEKRKVPKRKSAGGAVAKSSEVPSSGADAAPADTESPSPEVSVYTSKCATPDLPVPTEQSSKAAPTASRGELSENGHSEATSPQACSEAQKTTATLEVHTSTKPTGACSSVASAIVLAAAEPSSTTSPDSDIKMFTNTSKVPSSRVEKRKVSCRRSSGGATAKSPDMPPLEADADPSKGKASDVQSLTVPKSTVSLGKSVGEPASKNQLNKQASKAVPEVQPSPMPKRKVQSARTSGGPARQALSETAPPEADADVPKSARPSEPKRRSSPVKSSKRVAAKAPDASDLQTDAKLNTCAAPDVHPSTSQKRRTSSVKPSTKVAAKDQMNTPPPEADASVPKSEVRKVLSSEVPKHKTLSTNSLDGGTASASQTKKSMRRGASAGPLDSAAVSKSDNVCANTVAPDGDVVASRWQRHRQGAQTSSISSARIRSVSREKPATGEIKNSGQADTPASGIGASATKWRPSLRLR